MKEEGLKSYTSKILQIDYRINPIKPHIIDIKSKSRLLSDLEGGSYLELCLTVKNSWGICLIENDQLNDNNSDIILITML